MKVCNKNKTINPNSKKILLTFFFQELLRETTKLPPSSRRPHQEKLIPVPRDGVSSLLREQCSLCAKEEERVECEFCVHFRVFKKY